MRPGRRGAGRSGARARRRRRPGPLPPPTPRTPWRGCRSSPAALRRS
uniref:Uncharacterized protein n=1 Tax=Arundo donax TaxID=35708 RepID=A0A0A9G2D6_ARUDO